MPKCCSAARQPNGAYLLWMTEGDHLELVDWNRSRAGAACSIEEGEIGDGATPETAAAIACAVARRPAS